MWEAPIGEGESPTIVLPQAGPNACGLCGAAVFLALPLGMSEFDLFLCIPLMNNANG